MRFSVFIVAIVVTCVIPVAPQAKVPLPPSVMDRGGLYLPGEDPGTVVSAPLLNTEIDARVSGPIVRYTIRHTFENGSDTWTEAIYTYPLPSDSAVDRLRMIVGEREIIGEIAPKAEAKRRYDAAKTAGKRASLVEQHRPNIFSTSLANVGPGEKVVVEIGFQERLKFDGSGFRLRMPLVVGPRYIPGTPIGKFSPAGWSQPTDQVPDADKVTPPLRTEEAGKGNPVALSVNLQPGFPIAVISSPSHDINVEDRPDGTFMVSLVDTMPADRDFTLVWTAEAGKNPSAGLFTETVDGERYALLMLTHPAGDQGAEVTPRDVIFIVDTSGSMEGASIDQAKAALRLALDRLRPDDRFRVIRFSNTYGEFQPGMSPVEKGAVNAAKDWVSALTAEGGTEIVAAVAQALTRPADPKRLTQVVLITDGAVGNEEALFNVISAGLGQARLFTVGIGSAPNGYLMTRAARAGRGTYTYIQNPAEVAQRMTELLTKLEHPALTDIRLTWRGAEKVTTIRPTQIPDLYLSEPLTVLAALPPGVSGVDISGSIGTGVWATGVELSGGQDRPGIAAVWARDRIRQLMDNRRHAEDPDAIKAEIVEVALKFDLVSKFTSLVAIDDQSARPSGERLAETEVPVNLPDGWSRDHVTGATGGGAQLQKAMMRSFDRTDPTLRRSLAASGRLVTSLPQTATSAQAYMAVGFILLLLGAALVVCRRRFQ